MEKEFYITSTQSGIFLGIYDFAAFLSSPIIGFFGDLKNSNKMRIISISLLLVTLGSYAIGATVFAKKPDQSLNPNLFWKYHISTILFKITIFNFVTQPNYTVHCVGHDASTGGVAGSLLHWRSGSTPEGSGKEKLY